MANILYANNAVGTLASGMTNVQTTLTLNPGFASLFPSPTPPQIFYVTITDAATQTLKEIVKVTAVSGNIFSIVRAQDGTTALSWNTNDIVEQCVIALELRNFENAAEGFFGSTGLNSAITPSTTLGVVGTTLADNANAGSWGEFITITGSVTPITNSTNTAIGGLGSLTPGDWDIFAHIVFNPSVGTTVSAVTVALSFVSGGFPGLGWQNNASNFPSGFGPIYIGTPIQRVNVSTSTPVFVNVNTAFSGGTMTAQTVARARRVR